METAQVISLDGDQAIKLPPGFRVSGDAVAIRKEGDAIILEPIGPAIWPEGFFEQIRIDDPAFNRPPQGEMPPIPPLH
jgi:virulence-associated protein VagC